MSSALRALVLLACSWSAAFSLRDVESEEIEDLGAWAMLLAAAIVVPFVMAVATAWRGDRDGRG